MSDGIPLRIATLTGRSERSLRRFTYTSETACSARSGHDASVVIGQVPNAEADPHGDNWDHDDRQWPATCSSCGYWFTGTDQWQRNDNAIYALPDGAEFAFRGSFGRCAPPGTMIRAGWADEFYPGRGESWLVALPDGSEWVTTQKASGGGHWEVTGTPPLITVSPSIASNSPTGWHGWIRDGKLVDA